MGKMPGEKIEATAVPSATSEKISPENTWAFEEIVAQYESPLLRYATCLVGHKFEDAQDVVQEVFIRLHKQLEKQGRESIRDLNSWLYRVTHNIAMDTGRKYQRVSRKRDAFKHDPTYKSAIVENAEESPDVLNANREMQSLAKKELENLPEEQRNVVILKVLQGMTLNEISKITGLKIGTVNYRLTQALQTLAQRMKYYGLME